MAGQRAGEDLPGQSGDGCPVTADFLFFSAAVTSQDLPECLVAEDGALPILQQFHAAAGHGDRSIPDAFIDSGGRTADQAVQFLLPAAGEVLPDGYRLMFHQPSDG